MSEHELKIEEIYLDNLISGVKKAEIRINDRDYQMGDILSFWHSLDEKTYCFRITHIHSGIGLKEEYVCLSVEREEDAE